MRRLRGRITRVARLGAVGAVLAAGSPMVAAPAVAAGNDNMTITSYDIAYDVGADGGAEVTENLDIRYRDASHHGFDRYIITGQGYSADKHRLYPMTNVQVTSSTGAPTPVERTRDGGAERLRIGDASRTVSGTQHYTLRYHLAGVVNKQSNSSTEFYWNAVGTDWRIPIDAANVTVKGPGPATRAVCYFGEKGSSQQCRASAGTTSSFSATNVGLGRGMTVVADLPTSTFTNTAPIIKDGSAADAFGQNGPLSSSTRTAADIGGGALAVALSAVGGAWYLRGRRSGDERFAGLGPGAMPAPGQEVEVVPNAPTPQTTVRFEPPQDTTPGLAGLIIDKHADERDIAGTIVDLAVRDYLKLQQIERKDWLLLANRQPPTTPLLPYEASLLNALFADGPQVRLSDLKNHFAGHLRAAKSGLEREGAERGWFAQTSSAGEAANIPVMMLCITLAMLSFIGAKALHLNGFLFAAGFAVIGLIAFVRAKQGGRRTAVGSAIADQARGFELYLKTAEAKQFRFEEAEQIFSRYMPYAVVFGLAERWAKVFGEVAAAAQAQGYSMAMPHWYMPYGGYGNIGGMGEIGSGLSSFSDVASSALSSTPGSSGGSGFSGGGSGGGGGGGGGGGW